MPPHGSGPMRFATPSLQWTLTTYSLPVSTGAPEFKIIGRVGAIKDVGTTVRVSIASNYSRKDNRGEWVESVKWNEVTIFNEATQGFVKRNLTKGDLVYTAGTLGQTSYERNGERVLAAIADLGHH